MTTRRLSREQLFQNRAYKTVMRPGILDEIVVSAFIDIFDVSGPVQVIALFGIARTIIGGAGQPRLDFTEPAVPTITALSTAAAIVAQINDILSWDGAVGSSIAPGDVPGVFDATESAWLGYMLLTTGTISVHEFVDAAGCTGTIDWYMAYLPILDTSIITAL